MVIPFPFFLLMLKASRRRRRFESIEGLHKAIEVERREADASPPPAVRERFKIDLERIERCDCYTMGPQSGGTAVHVLYLHGGAHVAEMSHHHWKLLADLVARTACTFHVPIYPLAPESSYRDAFKVVVEVYRRLFDHGGAPSVVLMGDSSGGGLALAVAQQLSQHGLPQPKEIVLISPWLDLSLSHPEIEELERRDPWLAKKGLVEAGRMWASGDDITQPMLSPVNGALRGLSPITIFIGGRDLLDADCRKLRVRAEQEGVEVRWIEEPAMIHVWPLLPIRQAESARAKMAMILRDRATL